MKPGTMKFICTLIRNGRQKISLERYLRKIPPDSSAVWKLRASYRTSNEWGGGQEADVEKGPRHQ